MSGYTACPGSGQQGTRVWCHVAPGRKTHWAHCPVCDKGLRVASMWATDVPRHKGTQDTTPMTVHCTYGGRPGTWDENSATNVVPGPDYGMFSFDKDPGFGPTTMFNIARSQIVPTGVTS